MAASSKGAAAPPQVDRTFKFASAGLGGIFGWCCIHPANTVAVRMSLHTLSNPEAKQPSFVRFFADTVKREGFVSLYSGLSAGITRQIFYATARFGLFEVYRDKLAEYRETDVWSRLISGTAAGGCAAIIACPAEVALVRMSNDKSLPAAERRGYTGVVSAATRIVREEGVLTFWRGCIPFVSRAMLVGACQVATVRRRLCVSHILTTVLV